MSEGYETYRGLLRLYDGFSSAPDAAAPPFEYDHSDPGLQELRRRYDLDRVAGEGDPLVRVAGGCATGSTAMCATSIPASRSSRIRSA